MATHEILKYLYQQEPACVVGMTRFIEVQDNFSDWCLDLAEVLEIDDAVDIANAVDELERAGILFLNMADPGDDYICAIEFREPPNPNQLHIPFSKENTVELFDNVKFIKAEFQIAVANGSEPYRKSIEGYVVEGTAYDQTYPIAVHKIEKGWVASFLETGLRCKGLPQETRFDAVYTAVAFLDGFKGSKKLEHAMKAAARRFKRMTATVKTAPTEEDS